ncbi:MAG: Hsp33 family molecular chaperone HslO [Bradymonadaceae bacterium]|nr:Hsp33 family molecular chaperone HslO [Lujinxingiaceae bacterium]
MPRKIEQRSDGVLRAMTEDGSFRIITICATNTAQGVLDAQGVGDEDDRRLVANLVVGAVLLREAMAPDYRLQAVLKHPIFGSVTADSFPEGQTRGLVQLPLDTPLELGDATHLTVIRAVHGGALHQGVVETTAEGGVSQALMTYLASSEQVHSVIAVGSIFDETGRVVHAGGYLVQLLPGADAEMLAVVIARLERASAIELLLERTLGAPEVLLHQLFGNIPHTILAENEVYYGCNCSEERVATALATLSDDDLEELFAGDDEVSIDCDYCGKVYDIDREAIDVQKNS